MKRIALGVLLVAVIVIGALGLHVLRGEDGRFYHDDFSDGRPPALPKGVREVDFETADHLALKAWYLGPDAPSRTLVLLHGTGATRAQLSPLARVVASHGIGVVLSDYRGFAGLPGRPSDAGLTLDGLAVVQAARQLSAPGAAIVIGGFSLGAPVAIRVAAQDHGVAGVVVLGAYTKVADLPNDRRRFPRNLLFHARFNAEAVISRVQAPILAIGSNDDQIIPMAVTERLLDQAKSEHKLVKIPNRTHDGLVQPVEPAASLIIDFIDGLA